MPQRPSQGRDIDAEQADSADGAVWRRIRQAIDQLQNDTPNGPAH